MPVTYYSSQNDKNSDGSKTATESKTRGKEKWELYVFKMHASDWLRL